MLNSRFSSELFHEVAITWFLENRKVGRRVTFYCTICSIDHNWRLRRRKFASGGHECGQGLTHFVALFSFLFSFFRQFCDRICFILFFWAFLFFLLSTYQIILSSNLFFFFSNDGFQLDQKWNFSCVRQLSFDSKMNSTASHLSERIWAVVLYVSLQLRFTWTASSCFVFWKFFFF